MKRLFYFVVVGVFLLMGCQDQLALRDDSPLDEIATKAGADEYTVQTSERYIFPSERDFKAWTDIVSLEDRLAACEVPASTLRAMTTSALVQAALNYPLNFIYSAYNDPTVAVDIIVKNSPLHHELFSRSDAAKELLRIFEKSTIEKGRLESMTNPGESRLTYGNEMFFDYLLASRMDGGVFSQRDKEALRVIARRKLAERQSDSETYSEVSLVPLRLIAEGSSAGSQSRTVNYWHWYTPFGVMFNAAERTEMTDTEIWYSTWYYANNYPTDAGVLGMASNCYNGNGYAWMINDPTAGSPNSATTSNSWLEDDGSLGNDINDLWGPTTFYEEATSSPIEKIYYLGADHSAIPYSGTRYISKWGSGPLMEHEPTYCPYPSSTRHFYHIRTSPLDSYSITGANHVSPNSNAFYSWQVMNPFHRLLLSCSAENVSPAGASPQIISLSDYSCTICCTEAGSYKITFEAKFGNTVVARSTKDIVCY